MLLSSGAAMALIARNIGKAVVNGLLACLRGTSNFQSLTLQNADLVHSQSISLEKSAKHT